MLACAALAACGGQSAEAEDPAAVARLAAEAWMRSDTDGLMAVACERMREQLEDSRAEREQMAQMMRSMGVDMKDVRFDFSRIAFETEETGEYSAKVRMTGALGVSIPGRPDEDREQDLVLSMVKEKGRWRLCSEIN
jgi:hypothetical protein